MTLDEDNPWTWQMKDVHGLLSDRQRRYVELLPEVYGMKTARGKVIDYELQPFQAWWHAHSPIALGQEAKGRIVEKGRGLGFTYMAAMDALLYAHIHDRITVPVAGRQAGTSDEFIDRCHDLVRDAKIAEFFDPRDDVTSRVELGNGSQLVPIPGGSPNAIRSKRVTHAVLDEYAFHPYPVELWRALRGSQSEGGTVDVISTHDGADTHYYQVLEDAKRGDLDFHCFNFPIHDADAWRQDVSMKTQLQDGLRLIAPWLAPGTLDEFRREDPLGYQQENLCLVMDAALSVLSRDAISNASNPDLPDWGQLLNGDETQYADVLAGVGATRPKRPDGDTDPVFLGVDFASAGDLSAFKLWSHTPAGPRQRWMEYLHGVDTPAQNALLHLIEESVGLSGALIDMTGPGTGLYEYAKRQLRCPVYGIHFSSTVAYRDASSKVGIKKAMALNLAWNLVEGGAQLLDSSPHSATQRRHLLAVRRANLDAPRKAEDGHGDGFWANALALWGLRTIRSERVEEDDEEKDLGDIL